MINVSDVAAILKKEWIGLIRDEAAQAEKQGKLTKKQVALIHEQGWFKILVPSIYGGRQLPLPEVLQIEEALAYADGSVGWEVTLCAGAGWFGGFLEPGTAMDVFRTEKMCVAGSGAIKGTAEKTAKGYLVKGLWPYNSGTPEATAFTANCVIVEKGQPVTDEKGQPQVLSFVFNRSEVNILNTWNAMGMVATASHSYEVKDLTVPENRAFVINSTPKVDAALYHYPFHQFAEATLAINLCGMALHFMELCGQLFTDKLNGDNMRHVNKDTLMDSYASHLQKLQSARQKLYYAVDMSWQVCAANKEISSSLLYKVTVASFTCMGTIRDCINFLYPYCGLQAADKDSAINRVWRDIQTAGQHSLLAGNGHN